jgi:uncharacterized protein (DUF305 family)
MRVLVGAVVAALLSFVAPVAVLAQEAADTAPLPAACAAGGVETSAQPPGAMGHDMAMPMDAGHQALMAGMDKMQADMMAGMRAEDLDVAFACGMIPHHQGAIAMARAELKYGKDPKMRELAEAIVKAQEREITEMLDWLKAHEK